MACSPGSHLPLGSDQSSYLGRCTSRTSTSGAPALPPSPSGRPAVGRHTTAKMTSVISEAAPPLPDQGLLHVSERIPRLVPAMPDPVPVRAEPPGGGSVVHAEVEEPSYPPLMAGIGDLHEEFHPAVQVPVHHV